MDGQLPNECFECGGDEFAWTGTAFVCKCCGIIQSQVRYEQDEEDFGVSKPKDLPVVCRIKKAKVEKKDPQYRAPQEVASDVQKVLREMAPVVAGQVGVSPDEMVNHTGHLWFEYLHHAGCEPEHCFGPHPTHLVMMEEDTTPLALQDDTVASGLRHDTGAECSSQMRVRPSAPWRLGRARVKRRRMQRQKLQPRQGAHAAAAVLEGRAREEDPTGVPGGGSGGGCGRGDEQLVAAGEEEAERKEASAEVALEEEGPPRPRLAAYPPRLSEASVLALLWMAAVNCHRPVLPVDLARWRNDGPLLRFARALRSAVPQRRRLRIARPAARRPFSLWALPPAAGVPVATLRVHHAAQELVDLGLPLARINEFALLPRLVAAGQFRGSRQVVGNAASAFMSLVSRRMLSMLSARGWPRLGAPRHGVVCGSLAKSPLGVGFLGHPPDIVAAACVLSAAIAKGAVARLPRRKNETGSQSAKGMEVEMGFEDISTRWEGMMCHEREVFWHQCECKTPSLDALLRLEPAVYGTPAWQHRPLSFGRTLQHKLFEDSSSLESGLDGHHALLDGMSLWQRTVEEPFLEGTVLSKQLALCIRGPLAIQRRLAVQGRIYSCARGLQMWARECVMRTVCAPARDLPQVVGYNAADALRDVSVAFIDHIFPLTEDDGICQKRIDKLPCVVPLGLRAWLRQVEPTGSLDHYLPRMEQNFADEIAMRETYAFDSRSFAEDFGVQDAQDLALFEAWLGRATDNPSLAEATLAAAAQGISASPRPKEEETGKSKKRPDVTQKKIRKRSRSPPWGGEVPQTPAKKSTSMPAASSFQGRRHSIELDALYSKAEKKKGCVRRPVGKLTRRKYLKEDIADLSARLHRALLGDADPPVKQSPGWLPGILVNEVVAEVGLKARRLDEFLDDPKERGKCLALLKKVYVPRLTRALVAENATRSIVGRRSGRMERWGGMPFLTEGGAVPTAPAGLCTTIIASAETILNQGQLPIAN